MDGHSGYNQIYIAKEDVPKTAFRCLGAIRTFEWVVMPFGLKNAGATYQIAMNSIFHDMIGRFMETNQPRSRAMESWDQTGRGHTW